MKSLKITLATVALTLFAHVSMAQESKDKSVEARAKKQTEMISEKLVLNKSQNEKVYQINLDFDKKNDVIKNNEGLTENQKREALDKNNALRFQQIKALLNADQIKKFEVAEAEYKQKQENRKNTQPRSSNSSK